MGVIVLTIGKTGSTNALHVAQDNTQPAICLIKEQLVFQLPTVLFADQIAEEERMKQQLVQELPIVPVVRVLRLVQEIRMKPQLVLAAVTVPVVRVLHLVQEIRMKLRLALVQEIVYVIRVLRLVQEIRMKPQLVRQLPIVFVLLVTLKPAVLLVPLVVVPTVVFLLSYNVLPLLLDITLLVLK